MNLSHDDVNTSTKHFQRVTPQYEQKKIFFSKQSNTIRIWMDMERYTTLSRFQKNILTSQ